MPVYSLNCRLKPLYRRPGPERNGIESLQHTSCAASVDVVNGIDHYVIKATTELRSCFRCCFRSRFNNYKIIVNSVHYVDGIDDVVIKATLGIHDERN
jgi:hypothetical protein